MKDDNLKILLHEHSIINKKIDDFINAQFIYISTILTLTTGSILIAIKIKSDTTFLSTFVQFLPYFLIIIGPTFMYKFNRSIILHGYRSFLEKEINKLANGKIVKGAELVKSKLLFKNPFTVLNYVIMTTLVIGSIFFCHHYQTNPYNMHFFIQIIITIGGLIYFIVANSRAFNTGLKFGYEMDKN